MALLMPLLDAPAAFAFDSHATPPEIAVEPPDDMIDFLGRRRECAEFAPEPGETLRPPPVGSRREWWRCEALPDEERALRRRYSGNATATAFLNQAPSEFRLDRIVTYIHDGSRPGKVEHAEQRGFDASGRIPWEMVLDLQASQGRATSVAVSWSAQPSRTIYLDNRMFPGLDLSSAWVAVREAPRESIDIEMRYGSGRGWCGDVDRDDRPRVSIHLGPEGVEVFRQERTNCNTNFDRLEPGAFAEPSQAPNR